MRSAARLERVLRSGRFAVTAELSPPDSADPQAVYDRAAKLANICDAINTPDASGAKAHMSSLGVAALLARRGYDVVMQLACRDRNRIALQGELLAAAALGIHSVLLITGDGVHAGDHPQARPVFDLDSIQLLRTARMMRDQGQYLSGRTLDSPPRLFLGAVENPFAPPYDFRPLRLAKKVEAGADFFQLQFCFDLPRFAQFMQAVRDLGLHERAFILAGVGPLRSVQSAEWMRNYIPGVFIPDELIRRLEGVLPGQQVEHGKRLCVEIIQQVQQIPGVHGVHVMAFRHEALAAEIIEDAGLLPRPELDLGELGPC